MKMLTCKDASHLISERQERPLGLRERWGLWLHLLICKYCRRFERQVAMLSRALRELGRRHAADTQQGIDLGPEARARIRAAIAARHEHD
jgi:hypothetical protein